VKQNDSFPSVQNAQPAEEAAPLYSAPYPDYRYEEEYPPEEQQPEGETMYADAPQEGWEGEQDDINYTGSWLGEDIPPEEEKPPKRTILSPAPASPPLSWR